MAYHICGGKPLHGEINVQGSKNGALPLLAAALLIPGKTRLTGCPDISDVRAMIALLKVQGCQVFGNQDEITIDASHISPAPCPPHLAKAMRSSIMLMGALMGRCHLAYVMQPGGCMIGKRPIDLHRAALEKMGASFLERADEIKVVAQRVEGSEITLPFPSVGVTETVLMAGVLSEGTTILHGAAIEPEIVQLCGFLTKAGANIDGVGSRTLTIHGTQSLCETDYAVSADRIVAGTYLMGAVATRGYVRVSGIHPSDLGMLPDMFQKMGGNIALGPDWVALDAGRADCNIPYLKTEVFPGFPTDLQSMLAVCLTTAQGNSMIEETIFEDRFKIVPQLWKMGARITMDGNRMFIRHVDRLKGKDVAAMDLRGGAALILAGLMARGETVVTGQQYVERGYEDIVRDLRRLGAVISIVQE